MRLLAKRQGSNPQAPDSVRKIFTRKDLEDAYRKSCCSDDKSGSKRRQRSQILSQELHNHDSDIGSQIKVLDTGVKFSAKKMNEYKSAADRLEDELKKKNNELIELSRETNALNEMLLGKNREAKRILELQSRIEEVNARTETKLHYRLSLRYMQQRVQKNSVVLDAHLSAMSDALNAAEKDRQKSRKMMNDIESALAKASNELNSVILEVEIENAHREEILAIKRNEAANAEKMKEWRLERESITKEMNASFANGKNGESLERNRQLLEELQKDLNELISRMEVKSNELAKLEETFTQVKEATGVNKLTALVSKIIHRLEEKDNLTLEKENAEKKLQSAKNSLESTNKKYIDLRADGLGDTPHPRSTIKNIGESIMTIKMEGKMIKSAIARLEKVLVEIRQGGIGLYQRLLSYHSSLLEGEVPTLNGNLNATPFQAAHDTLEMLRSSEQILTKMLDAVGGPRIFRFGGKEIDTHTPTGPTLEDSVNLQGNNCRVEATKNIISPRFVNDDMASFASDEQIEVTSDQIISRVAIKRSSDLQVDEAKRLTNKEHTHMLKHRSSESRQSSSSVANKLEAKQDSGTKNNRTKNNTPKSPLKASSCKNDPITKATFFLTEMPNLD